MRGSHKGRRGVRKKDPVEALLGNDDGAMHPLRGGRANAYALGQFVVLKLLRLLVLLQRQSCVATTSSSK